MTKCGKRRLAVGMAAGLLMVASGVQAGGKVHRQMRTMDTNQDGKISAEEHQEGAKKMFETMDADKDGNVTEKEMTAAHDKIAGGRPMKGAMTAAAKIKTIDTDGDGVLTAEEHAAGASTMFGKMDLDQDGELTKQEFGQGHRKLLHKRSK